MNTKNLFQGMYDDFFNVENEINSEQKDEKQVVMGDMFFQIDSVLLDDDSKSLLKQIIEYMRKYQEKIESNYIPFNIVIDNKDKNNAKQIIDIIENAAKQYDYLENNNKQEISFYHINKDINITDIYKENGLIVFNDLTGFESLEETTKKAIVNDLYNSINNLKTITLFCGTKKEIDDFLLNSKKLKEYISFYLNYKAPDVQDIYQSIISKTNIEENQQVELLDYITATINEVDDYNNYQEFLIREISFHKRIPALEKVKTMDEVFAELNELVGLKKVKKVLYELVDVMDLKKKNSDLKISGLNLHMVFLGNPGTGKTTVARIIANILYNLKYIKTNNLIEVSAKDLVAEYVGQTAPKTNAVIEKALGGVLFIDEAYSLAVKNDNSYNAEAIATLIQAMENYRDNLVVIFAGYTKEMQAFLNSNSGITSRIGYTLEFDDYTEDELVEIFKSMVKKNGFIVTDDAIDYLRVIIKDNKDKENFGNARFIRNVYEKTVVRHAANTKKYKQKKYLKTITKEDINTDNLI